MGPVPRALPAPEHMPKLSDLGMKVAYPELEVAASYQKVIIHTFQRDLLVHHDFRDATSAHCQASVVLPVALVDNLKAIDLPPGASMVCNPVPSSSYSLRTAH